MSKYTAFGDDLVIASEGHSPRPLNREFYEELRSWPRPIVRSAQTISEPSGHCVEIAAGELLRVELLEGAQIVNIFMLNVHDPRDRYWAHDTVSEAFFLTRYSRLWGTMPRCRPLLTMTEDTLTSRPLGAMSGRHHAVFGGSGTPADWHFGNGPARVMTTWEQFVSILKRRGLDPNLLKDNACLFQKTAIDAHSQRLEILPSDAVRGDYVDFFAEVDLLVLIALSPYIDGSRPATDLGGVQPRAIEVQVTEGIRDPLPWPYPGIPYPDLSLYLTPEPKQTRRESK